MYQLKLLMMFAGISVVFGENCAKIPRINLTVQYSVDSDRQNVTVENAIEFQDDVFSLTVANESLPQFCQNQIHISNEVSVLQILNCSTGDLQPGAFNVTATLTLLKISWNPLATIKKGVFNSVRVKELDLSRNVISSIDADAFDDNHHLEVVKLNYNAIKELDANWFKNSPGVYKLSVIYNEITDLPANVFNNMAKNRPLKLRLSANHILQVSPDVLNGHRTVDVLRLNGNKLVELPGNMFVNRSIYSLQINSNNLRCFPETMYKAEVHILAFLENAHFNCECLKKVRTFVEKHHVDVLYPAIICEDRAREVNVVFNNNKTYEIPLLLPSTDGRRK